MRSAPEFLPCVRQCSDRHNWGVGWVYQTKALGVLSCRHAEGETWAFCKQAPQGSGTNETEVVSLGRVDCSY